MDRENGIEIVRTDSAQQQPISPDGRERGAQTVGRVLTSATLPKQLTHALATPDDAAISQCPERVRWADSRRDNAAPRARN